MLNIFIVEDKESEDFQKLKEAVRIIDEDYKKFWSNTALQERISFYQRSDVRTIFTTFVNLDHSLGYYLVIKLYCHIFIFTLLLKTILY